MRSRTSSWTEALLLGLVLLAAFPTGARGEAPGARQRFEQGVAAYREGRFEDARAAFDAAYALRPRPVVLLNLARSHHKLGHDLIARRLYDQILAEPASGEIHDAARRYRAEIATAAGDSGGAARSSAAGSSLAVSAAAAPAAPPGAPASAGSAAEPADGGARAAAAPADGKARAAAAPTAGAFAPGAGALGPALLRRAAPPPRRWYRSPWLWSAVAVVVTGGAVGATLGLTLGRAEAGPNPLRVTFP